MREFSWKAGDRILDRAEGLEPRLAEHFLLFTDDEDAARDYLVPRVVDGLVQIAEEQKTGHLGIQAHIEGIFYDDWLCLKIPITYDFLKIGDVHTPMTEIEDDLPRALWDLTLPRRIIDRLVDA